MNGASALLLLFVAAIAAIPWGIKWWQKHTGRGLAATNDAAKLVSVLNLSPTQRVVTIDVAHQGTTTRMVLGVAGPQMNCLHVFPPTAAFAKQLQDENHA